MLPAGPFLPGAYVWSAARADRQARHFVDNLTVQVEAGNGGDGCVAFHREKFVAMGPAAGGNGGAGGSVYIRSDATLHSLARVPKQVVAKSGAHGQGAWLHGRRGQDTIISVPVGTTVRSLGQTANMRRQSVQAYYEYLFGSNARHGAGRTPGKPRYGHRHVSRSTGTIVAAYAHRHHVESLWRRGPGPHQRRACL